ncbi:MAG: hypothetical protein C0401_09745 [Anaerolinea sp.]|nr:hypothetical protein [Anaerolinea sp.]
MKTKRIFIVLSLVVALIMISSQVTASPNLIENKKTPPGLLKTPGVMATQKAEDRAAGIVGNPHGKRENYKGTITAVDAASITLTLKDDASVTIVLTPETRIRIPSVKDAVVDGLIPGMTVMVQAIRGQDDALTARSVAVIPGKPTKTHHVGIVTAYEPGISITIQAKDEQLYTYLLTETTKILPAERLDLLVVGARVTIISPRDVTSLDQTAKGIVVHPSSVGPTEVEPTEVEPTEVEPTVIPL